MNQRKKEAYYLGCASFFNVGSFLFFYHSSVNHFIDSFS